MLTTQRTTFRDSQPNSYFDRSHALPRISRLSQRTSQQPNSPPTMTTNRKRPRPEGNAYDVVDSFNVRSPPTDLAASISSVDCLSPAPLANTDYFLSGGVDTPGAWSCQKDEHLELFEAEQDHRWNRFAHQTQQEQSFFISAHDKSQNIQHSEQQMVRTRMFSEQQQPQQPQQSSISGWHLRRAAWAITGGLAGKIFNFCWNTTFRGFSAGGGQPYYAADDGSAAANYTGDGVHYPQRLHAAHDSTPTPTTRAASRPGTERSVTRSSWVFVERVDVAERAGGRGGDEHSPARKKSRASMAGRTSSNSSGSHWHSTSSQDEQATTMNAHTASFASPRSRALGSSNTSTAGYSSAYHGLSPSQNKRQRTSLALVSPTTRRQSSQSDLHAVQQALPTSQSPEVEAFKRQKRRENRRQDESLRRLNTQLQDMIREGKQALGSKVEVFDGSRYGGTGGGGGDEDDYDMDEGCFVDDEVRYH